MRTGWGGQGRDAKKFCSLHGFKLRLHLSGREGVRGLISNPVSQPLHGTPACSPGRVGTTPTGLPRVSSSPQPPGLPPPTTSSLRHRDGMQGLEGPGWTSGPQADQRPWQVGILSWMFCFIHRFNYPLSPHVLKIFCSTRKRDDILPINGLPLPPCCSRRRGASQMTRCNLTSPTPHQKQRRQQGKE